MLDFATMIHVIEIIKAVPGKEKKLKLALMELIPLSRAEDGCMMYDLFQDKESPQIFMVFMTWRNQDDLYRHHQASFIDQFMKKYENVLYESAIETLYHKLG